jgi:hypothetical protein
VSIIYNGIKIKDSFELYGIPALVNHREIIDKYQSEEEKEEDDWRPVSYVI